MAEPHITNSTMADTNPGWGTLTVQPLAGAERSIAISVGAPKGFLPWPIPGSYGAPTARNLTLGSPALLDTNVTQGTEMPAQEIQVRLRNCQLEAQNTELLRIIAEMQAGVDSQYGEQCDDGAIEPDGKPGIPAQALRFTAQRIGLFTPR